MQDHPKLGLGSPIRIPYHTLITADNYIGHDTVCTDIVKLNTQT